MVRSRLSQERRKSPVKVRRGAAKKPDGGGQVGASMQVVVRVRPPNRRELEANARRIVDVVSEQGLVFDPKQSEDPFFYHGSTQRNRDVTKKVNKNVEFSFDRVFDETASNTEVYDFSTKEILKALFEGYNCSVFAYGATGSGKTFTMLGNSENPGIAYQTMVELYDRVHSLSEEYDFDIRVSYLEVYNEVVRDLLQPDSKQLHLRDDGSSSVTIVNLTMCKISSAEELFARLTEGNANRTQHPTDSNAESSRSHAVFQTYIHSRLKKTKQQQLVKLSMIDLAGSEKASATGGRGARFTEGQNINRSLLALGNCINSLAAGTKHIPYRDSKLTRLLKDSLGGNCRTVMIANISPCHSAYEDTHRTLNYAERAKKIKLKVCKNIPQSSLSRMQYDKLVGSLQSENVALKEELACLKEKLNMLEAGPSSTGNLQEPVTLECVGNVAGSEAMLETAGSVAGGGAVLDKSVQACVASEDSDEYKQMSSVTVGLEVEQGLYTRLSWSEINLRRLQWRCYRRLVTMRRLNSLASDQQDLNKREGRATSGVQAAVQQAREHHKNIVSLRQQIETVRHDTQQTLADSAESVLYNYQLQGEVEQGKMCMELLRELNKLLLGQMERDDEVIRTLCVSLKTHHMLLKGYGKVTDNMAQEFRDCVKMLASDKAVKFAAEPLHGGRLERLAELLQRSDRDACMDGPRPASHFEDWVEATTAVLDEVVSSSVQRESVMLACTTVEHNSNPLEATFTLVADPAQPASEHGSFEDKENRLATTVAGETVRVPGKLVKKKLQQADGGPSQPDASKVLGSRVPLAVRGQCLPGGMKFPTSKLKTSLPRFHPYRGSESEPRLRQPKLLKKPSF